ncbi:MAG: FlgO family outer membrane protein [Nitrospirota bacterium]
MRSTALSVISAVSLVLLPAMASGEQTAGQPKAAPIEVVTTQSSVGHLNASLIFLADQLERNVDKKYYANPVIVTSFVNLDNVKKTSGLGRLISENLMHELQVRKWNVIDIRLVKEVVIDESGEFSLSRDIKKIKDSYNIRGIVTGTYSTVDDHMIVNARVMDIDSGIVISTGQMALPLDGIEQLAFSDIGAKAIRIRNEAKEVPQAEEKKAQDRTEDIKRVVDEEFRKRDTSELNKKIEAMIKANEELARKIEEESARIREEQQQAKKKKTK